MNISRSESSIKDFKLKLWVWGVISEKQVLRMSLFLSFFLSFFLQWTYSSHHSIFWPNFLPSVRKFFWAVQRHKIFMCGGVVAMATPIMWYPFTTFAMVAAKVKIGMMNRKISYNFHVCGRCCHGNSIFHLFREASVATLSNKLKIKTFHCIWK